MYLFGIIAIFFYIVETGELKQCTVTVKMFRRFKNLVKNKTTLFQCLPVFVRRK